MTQDDLISKVFQLIVGVEGGYDTDPRDSGNWTGGKCGVGKLLGTKYGVDCASHPGVDIASLTLQQAEKIFATGYWYPNGCDTLPPSLALLVADAAYNGGSPKQWMQTAVGTTPDGDVGPATRACINKAFFSADDKGAAVLDSFQSLHCAYLASLSVWPTYGASNGVPHGWVSRLFLMHRSAIELLGEPIPPGQLTGTLGMLGTLTGTGNIEPIVGTLTTSRNPILQTAA